jgi:hypothetical protein
MAQSLGTEREIQRANAHWESAAEPTNKQCPEDQSQLTIRQQLLNESSDGTVTVQHVGECPNGHVWIYAGGKGWQRPSQPDLTRIRGD